MLRCDCTVTDLSHVDTPIKFAPEAVQKVAVRLQTFFISIKIMLEILRQTVFICLFPFSLKKPAFSQKFHGDIKCLGQFIHRFCGTFFYPGFPAADITQCRMGDTSQNGKAILRHPAFCQ